ncbi:MAG: DNA alkylation repair protein [Erysipelothrix sp.]|nr:DNA alkylation repair protein [Erysipelothrix sp.]
MVKTVKLAIDKLQELEQSSHLVTGDIRKLSSELYWGLHDKSIDHVFSICEELLEKRQWALGVIAYDFAFRVKKQYNDTTYEVFYRWLREYVRGWGDCDDFCTHAFGELIRQDKRLFEQVLSWTQSSDFWVRRASAVVLIPAISKKEYDGINPLMIADALLVDDHHLVLKGYGWMLKVLSVVDPSMVKDYLIKNHARMPRVSFRYACEKFDKETRDSLMKL